MLVMPPVSDRGLTRTPLEASGSHSNSSRKAWFAVYTAPRHEKFVQAQLIAKQIQSFLPLYTVVRRWRNRVQREIQYPLLPGYVFVCLGTRRMASRAADFGRGLHRGERVVTHHRSTITRCTCSASVHNAHRLCRIRSYVRATWFVSGADLSGGLTDTWSAMGATCHLLSVFN